MSFPSAFRSLARCLALLSTAVLSFSNQPPSISRILDHSTLVCTPISIPFTISDAESAPDQLIVSASSSNTHQLGNANIALAGTGTNRTITLSTSNIGVVAVTITVSDGANETTASFNLVTSSCAGVPVLPPIADVTMWENTTVQVPLKSFFCDPCLGPTTIVWFATSYSASLFPTSSISIFPNDSTATLVLAPTVKQAGQARLAVVASDGASTVSQSFSVTVTAVGTWTDHFEFATLNPEWTGTKGSFFITNGVLQRPECISPRSVALQFP